MTAMRRIPGVALWIACAAAVGSAATLELSPRDITEAIEIGRSRSARDQARFHAPYRLKVDRPPVDYVDVITPFRRVVLAADGRQQLGDRSFGQRDAMAMLAAAPADVEVRIELTFHPLNTYVGVPPYDVSLIDAAGRRIRPRHIERLPRHGPRVDGMPPALPTPTGPPLPAGTEPMLGGTAVAHFDATMLAPTGRYDVLIEESGREIARVRADLGAMR